uniref:Gustatory receptor n=1 Tax=Tetranychus urticae TaxID=32264 RepID=T1KRK5_TETUR
MDSNELKDIIEKSTKPSSIYAKSILRENISSQVVHLFTSISFLLYATVKLINEFSKNTPLGIKISTLTYDRCIIIANFLFSTSLFATILLYKYKGPIYVEYINYFQSSIKNGSCGLAQASYVNKWQKINRFIIILQLLIRITMRFFEYYANPFHLTYNYIDIILSYMCELGLILEQQFIYETCIYLQSNFIFFHFFLDSLTKKVNESPGVDVYHVIKLVRHMHSHTIEFTRRIDPFFRLTVFNTFGFLSVYSICIIGMLSATDQTISQILILIGRATYFATLIFVTSYHFARVNYLSMQICNTVHGFTLSPNLARSIDTMNEINLFLLRISRDDVGFTFAGLCVVSVNFISSLAIITLTIGLALPGIFK